MNLASLIFIIVASGIAAAMCAIAKGAASVIFDGSKWDWEEVQYIFFMFWVGGSILVIGMNFIVIVGRHIH